MSQVAFRSWLTLGRSVIHQVVLHIVVGRDGGTQRITVRFGVNLEDDLIQRFQLDREPNGAWFRQVDLKPGDGWRRNEPGIVTSVEQPSLMARAVELISQEQIDEEQLISQCRVPRKLFRVVISRTPSAEPPTPAPPNPEATHPKIAALLSLAAE